MRARRCPTHRSGGPVAHRANLGRAARSRTIRSCAAPSRHEGHLQCSCRRVLPIAQNSTAPAGPDRADCRDLLNFPLASEAMGRGVHEPGDRLGHYLLERDVGLARLDVVAERRLEFDATVLATADQIADLGLVLRQRRTDCEKGVQYLRCRRRTVRQRLCEQPQHERIEATGYAIAQYARRLGSHT
jgi:hypothetical protein